VPIRIVSLLNADILETESIYRHHPGIVLAIIPEPVIGMPGTLIGIVRNPQPLLKLGLRSHSEVLGNVRR
jgi:hypothetical protein